MNLKARIGLLVVIPQFALYALSNVPGTETYVRVQEVEASPSYKVVETLHAEISAYTSDVAETDDSPFITANGDTVGEGTIACPTRYKFGTLIEIEDRIYKCNDRMAKRFRNNSNFDIWFPEKESALAFGRQRITVFILNVVE